MTKCCRRTRRLDSEWEKNLDHCGCPGCITDTEQAPWGSSWDRVTYGWSDTWTASSWPFRERSRRKCTLCIDCWKNGTQNYCGRVENEHDWSELLRLTKEVVEKERGYKGKVNSGRWHRNGKIAPLPHESRNYLHWDWVAHTLSRASAKNCYHVHSWVVRTGM